MKADNEINIHITKALVTRVSIDLEGEKPKYVISGWLTTDSGRKVSEFSFWSETWVSKDKQIEIPIDVHRYAAEIFKTLKPLIYLKLNEEWPWLASGLEKKEEIPS